MRIEVPALELKISDLQFAQYAEDFFNAGKACPVNKIFNPVPYYLYCHCIELALKAICLRFGDTTKIVKNEIRHDLEDAVAHAEQKLRVTLLSESERMEIKKANDLYKQKGFEYFSGRAGKSLLKGRTDFPSLPALILISSKLLSELRHQRILN